MNRDYIKWVVYLHSVQNLFTYLKKDSCNGANCKCWSHINNITRGAYAN